MAKEIPATKKNSPAIHTGANRNNLPAEDYEIPHTMSGKKVDIRDDVGFDDSC